MDFAGIIILLIFFVPLILVSLCHRKIPKRKSLKVEQYISTLQAHKSNIRVTSVSETDIKKIKKTLNSSASIIGITIAIDIFAILGYIGISRNNETELLSYVLFFGVLILFSFLCIVITLKRDNIFTQPDHFQKTTGVILEHKAKYYATNAYKKPAIYTVKLGTYIDNKDPVVIQLEIPSQIFNYILEGEPWWIITYKNTPITVIKE